MKLSYFISPLHGQKYCVSILRLTVFTFHILWANILLGQLSNLGIPPVISFPKNLTQAGTQTWDIIEDEKGYTYFANNEGLVVFDGYDWEVYPLPNETIVRSVAIEGKGKIFVGGQGEFGYFSPEKNGSLRYHSLATKSKDSNVALEDVWDVIATSQGVFFRTDKQVYRYYKGDVFAMYEGSKSLNFMGLWGKDLVIQDNSNQLYYFENSRFQPRKRYPVFDKGRISGVLNYSSDTVLITTIDKGIFFESGSDFKTWSNPYNEFFKKNIIYSAAMMKNGRILIGTSFNGLFVLDKMRRVVHHINKKHGLQNNSVLSTFGTAHGKIWAGLDNGINLIDLDSPFRRYYPDGELEGTGYAAILHNNQLYFGTNTGLYTLPWKDFYQPEETQKARLIENTRGQVWSLKELGDKLLVGHHEGAFEVDGNSGKRISKIYGFWKFLQINERLAIGGHYKGLALFELINGGWQFNRQLEGFSESSRIMAFDNQQNLWVAHPYRGLFHIKNEELFKPKIETLKFTNEGNRDVPLENYFYELDNQILFRRGNNFFKLRDEETRLEIFSELDGVLPPAGSLRYFLQDSYKNIWFGTKDDAGVLIPEKRFKPFYHKYSLLELKSKLPKGFESVYTIDEHNVIFPTEKGFLFFDPSAYFSVESGPILFLSKAILHVQKDSLLYSAHAVRTSENLSFNLGHNQNELSFHFSVIGVGDKEMIGYSHMLKGIDNEWSAWESSQKVDLRKLSPGRYTLMMKARNQNGTESQPLYIEIRILKVWYAPLMYVMGVISLISLAIVTYFFQKKKYEKEKNQILELNRKREEEYRIYAQASQEEITRLQNEKLLSEINYKNQELTSFTYHLVNKNELISKINALVNRLAKKLNQHPEVKKELLQIQKLTEHNANVDEHWEEFIMNFDKVHANFYKRLTEDFKDLSPNDYRLCTYLRMNLTSKEISVLMNISIRSVETNRYRLRKKLGIERDVNLNQFLMNY